MTPDPRLRRKYIGSFLSNARKGKKLSQWGLAKQLGYKSPQFVSNWERGMSLPPMDTLPLLADILGLARSKVIDVFQAYQSKEMAAQQKRLKRKLRELRVG